MRASTLKDSLERLTAVVQEVQAVLDSMRAEHDALASHIYTSRRDYRKMQDTKSGKRRAVAARLSWQTACELGFRGTVSEWERLLGAAPPR